MEESIFYFHKLEFQMLNQKNEESIRKIQN